MEKNFMFGRVLATVLAFAFVHGARADVSTNYWVKAPYVTPTAWREADNASAVFFNGQPKFGKVEVTYSNRLDKVDLGGTRPTTEGEYAAWFKVPATKEYTGLAKECVFSISRVPGVQNGEGYYSVYDYADQMTIVFSGYKGETGVTDIPVYIKIKEGTPSGFKYTSMRNLDKDTDPEKGDIRFFDSTGHLLNHEIAKWVWGGESAFWVHVPLLRAGTTITMCWNLRDGCTLPDAAGARGLWSDYVGVWHMDEEIGASASGVSNSVDATGHGLDAVPIGNTTTMISRDDGIFGRARWTDNSGTAGSYLRVPNTNGQLDIDDTFTLSFWAKIQGYKGSSILVSRRPDASSNGGFEIALPASDATMTKMLVSGDSVSADAIQVSSSPLANLGFTHYAFVYHGNEVDVYANGVAKITNSPIFAATNPGKQIGMGLGDNAAGDGQSFYGAFDEVRLYRGKRTADWLKAEYDNGKTSGFYTYGSITNDSEAVLKNTWVSEPTITKSTWTVGTAPTLDDFNIDPKHGEKKDAVIIFYDRATGACLGETVPTGVGDYRAVITVPSNTEPADDRWGALESTVTFRIVSNESHASLGINVDRVLLAHADNSVDGGEVQYQAYNEETRQHGMPYWRHLDEYGADASTSTNDVWSVSRLYNFGGGTVHEYRQGYDQDDPETQGELYWYMQGVRLGNTFNSYEESGWDDEGQGFWEEQNYLPWNPKSEPVLDDGMGAIGDIHQLTGQILLQNTLDAAVYSRCFSEGIGTIYFDAVNGWANNVTNALGQANYCLELQMTTNLTVNEYHPDGGVPEDRFVLPESTSGRIVPQPDEAVWQTVPMRVIRFYGDGTSKELGTRTALTLECESGGGIGDFYRIIAPVNTAAEGRFRIVRTAIDTDQKYNPDGEAFILLDNLICSKPTGHIDLQPYGRYFAEKTGAKTLGWEGALTPAFPAISDADVRGRAKRVDTAETTDYPITSAAMHYRWHYLEQKDTGWKVADLDPKTLVSLKPLELPTFEGDIEFWFDANQQGDFYTYVDYSGTGRKLGDTGYSEEMASVTNRASGADWFVRVRPGTSEVGEMALVVKTGEYATPTVVNMSLFDNDTWRGHYRMTEVLPEGIYWRVEPRNRQTDGSTAWQANTNYWYEATWTEKTPSMPASGRMIVGDENSWSRMVCDMKSGYLTFQVSESTKGISVCHSDYQDFNSWNDAAKGCFTGSSTEKGRIVGTSSGVKQFDQTFTGFEETVATNINWNTLYKGMINDGTYQPAYKTFTSGESEQWDYSYGQWGYAKYREPTSHVAFVMRGRSMGEMMLQNANKGSEGWPRGFDAISFDARIAQPISPDIAAYNDAGYYNESTKRVVNPNKMADYTFMARGCFDMNKNQNFAGNAALSLFAYYRPDVGAYEARWEQIAGEVGASDPYKETILGPHVRGQRLVISRWNKVGDKVVETELYAVTNNVKGGILCDMPTMPYKSSALTNNLLPMCISVYKYNQKTFIVAGVRISGDLQSWGLTGASWDTELNARYPGYSNDWMQNRWHMIWFCDESDLKLESGTYGVLASNCEGMFLRPQFRPAATWPGNSNKTQETLYNLVIGKNWPYKKVYSGFYRYDKLCSVTDYTDCYADMADECWSNLSPGRQSCFVGDAASQPFGVVYVEPSQCIDVYMSEISSAGLPDGNWEKRLSIPIKGFGKPGLQPDYDNHVYVREKAALKLKAGGDIDGCRTDIAISNVKISQLLGQDDWSSYDKDWDRKSDTKKEGSNNYYGITNIVFTSGWVTNGAVRLSAKRTRPGEASSVRSPVMLPNGDSRIESGRGSGLGMISIKYRKPQENVRLKVQFVTNEIAQADVKDWTRASDNSTEYEWITATNLNYTALMKTYDAKKGFGEYSYAFGFHGVPGMMRIVVDDTLTRELESYTNPNKFGEIDILEVECKDEPSLDKAYWWGWNMQIVGDVCDTQRRMYLPDSANTLSLSGRSLALNNSVSDGISADEKAADFKAHMPFVQSPMFTNAAIGQVSFKARKFDLSDRSPAAKVVVYGATEDIGADKMADDVNWTYITQFPITNTIYTTFTYKYDRQDIRVMRLAVVDVPDTKSPPTEPPEGDPAQRILIDEVVVSEAISAVLSFGNVGAFRTNLRDDTPIENVPSKEQQPLCEENWGIQAQIVSTMLEEEIDKSYTPEVYLHWYIGDQPWGWENWKSIKVGQRDAKGTVIRGSAQLMQDSATNWVYRSSYKTCPDAIMPAQYTQGQVVQYMLSVSYKTINPFTRKSQWSTNWLDAASWTTPNWYAPVDYNADADHGKGDAKNFAGFTILDTIAPGWAWINEVNLLGTYDDSFNNSDQKFQYVEVCVPAEADLTGWTLRMLDVNNNNKVTTNNVATFGDTSWDQAPGKKAGNRGIASNMVFRCVGNMESAKMKKSDGTLDGVWLFSTYDSVFRKRNGVECVFDVEMPIGVQLVRPSGVIEHSVVVVGTNGWEDTTHAYDPTNIVAKLNRYVPGSKFFYAGPDHCGTNQSVSVISGQGDSPSVWTNNWACSPGRINTNYTGKVQQIPLDHPTPSGEMIILYASVDKTYGPIQQWIGGKGSTATNDVEMVYIRRGGEGTNICYRAGTWYELTSVVSDKGTKYWTYQPHTREITVPVGAGVSNNISVVASAQVDSRLKELGLTDDNPYKDAVMAWLVKGKDAYGNPFAYPDSGEIGLADFIALNRQVITNMTLTQMYWLDMDPTVSNLALCAGMSKTWPEIKGVDPLDKPVPSYEGQSVLTSTWMRVYMAITNRTTHASWTPYILRGLEPDFTSWDFKTNSVKRWESETFKVTGILANGKTRESNPENWIPLRWFVFVEDSFGKPGDNNEFTTDIEIVDPHSEQSYAGKTAGWYDWCRKHGYTPIFNSWSIDERLKPVNPDILQPTNRVLEVEGSY